MISTVLHFKNGGCYDKFENSWRWISKEDRSYVIVVKTKSTEDITYSVLEDKIFKKLGLKDRGSTKLKLSYLPMSVGDKDPSYMFDDDDVYGYIMSIDKNGQRSVLHVEVSDVVGTNNESLESNVNNVVGGEHVDVDVDVEVPDVEVPDVEVPDVEVPDVEVPDVDVDVVDVEDVEDVEDVDVEDPDVDLDEDDDEEWMGEEGDSDSEDGDEVIEMFERRSDGIHSQTQREWDDSMGLELGQEFASKFEVQEKIIRAALQQSFDFQICNTDSLRYVVKCRAFGCHWYLRVVRDGKVGNWKLVRYRNMHSCSPVETSTTTNKRKGTVKLVASVIKDSYPGSLDTPPARSIIGLVQNNAGVKVSYSTAWRGKKRAENCVRGNAEKSYKILHQYLFMLESLNPGTVTKCEVDEQIRFKYLFVALGACIEGFAAMRKVLSVDATHLKTVHNGVLVFATAQDPDHHHYPIALAILDSENDASWNWFFGQMRTIVRDEASLVWISDRNASLIKGIANLYPRAKHGFCMYHLAQNVKGQVYNVKKDGCGSKFMELAQIYTEEKFRKEYAKFGTMYPKAVEYLETSVREGPKKWARCYFPGERYNITTTNASESLNSVFRKARKYSVLHMLDKIIEKQAEWFNRHRKASARSGASARKLVPVVDKELSLRCNDANKLKVDELNSFMLEYRVIGKDGHAYIVDLREKRCTCKCFDIDKYPCVHAIAALLAYRKTEDRRGDIHIHDLCSTYYLMDTWALAYCRTIYPVPHKKQWFGMPDNIKNMKVKPPHYEPRKGRLQETRIPSAGEGKRKRKKKKKKKNNHVEEDNLEGMAVRMADGMAYRTRYGTTYGTVDGTAGSSTGSDSD